jgi:hypothetical protein
MYKFRNSLISLAGLLLLVGVIALVTPHVAVSQGSGTNAAAKASPTPADVNVVNTPAVLAQQSGPWSVGIDSSANAVKIDTTNPLPVRDVDNPARQPFVFFMAAALNHWFGTAPNIDLQFSVPAGKRLVIEQISIEADLTPTASQELRGAVRTSVGGSFYDYAFVGTDSGQDGIFEDFIASSQMKSYADPGTAVQIFVTRNDTSGGSADKAEVNLSGYLIDMP